VNANIQSDKSGNQLISVKASPVVSPTVFGWAKMTELSAGLKKFYSQMPVSKLKQGNGFGCTVFPETNCNNLNWLSTLRGADYSESGMVELNLWIKYLKDKATVAPTFWNFKNMQFGSFSNCPQSKKDLIGIVSTNSTGYISGPPTFDSKTRSLDYKVLSPHYLADDSVFIGSYDLVINSKLARCLYDFSEAPIQASISIIKEDGVSTVATTSIKEKNGYLHLGAYGFTFSNPTLRVKLTQKKNQKYTITCNKGSVSKSVTGTSPKCPRGYKESY
jgi:hypothetical protein